LQKITEWFDRLGRAGHRLTGGKIKIGRTKMFKKVMELEGVFSTVKAFNAAIFNATGDDLFTAENQEELDQWIKEGFVEFSPDANQTIINADI
jgi:hypothetical protein